MIELAQFLMVQLSANGKHHLTGIMPIHDMMLIGKDVPAANNNNKQIDLMSELPCIEDFGRIDINRGSIRIMNAMMKISLKWKRSLITIMTSTHQM